MDEANLNSYQFLLLNQAKLMSLQVVAEAMKAENQQRIAMGESMAYTAKEFDEVKREIDSIVEELK